MPGPHSTQSVFILFSQWDEFGASEAGVAMWGRLGFNVVPTDGVSAARGTLSPSNRSGAGWHGMRYGVMMNLGGGRGPTAAEMGAFAALRLTPAAAASLNLSAAGVPAARLATERAKLVAAAAFYAQHKPVMDVGE